MASTRATTYYEYMVWQASPGDANAISETLNNYGVMGWKLISTIAVGPQHVLGIMERSYQSDAPAAEFIQAALTNGSAAVAQPDWVKLNFSTVNSGNAAVTGSGDLQLGQWVGQSAELELSIQVQQNWDKNVLFGFAWDGGAVTQFASQTINSNDFISVVADLIGPLGTVLSLFISSDFLYQDTLWQGGMVNIYPPGKERRPIYDDINADVHEQADAHRHEQHHASDYEDEGAAASYADADEAEHAVEADQPPHRDHPTPARHKRKPSPRRKK